jgi:tetratricopeptide (TPR) repeat protein
MADDPLALIERSNDARRNGQAAIALELAQEAVDIARAGDDLDELGAAVAALARLRRDARQYDAAVDLYEEAAAAARQRGDGLALAHRLRHIGDVVTEQGDLRRAEDAYVEVERLFGEAKVGELNTANFLRSKALLREKQGQDSMACQLWDEARALYAARGIDAGVSECDRHIAQLRAD